MKNKYILVVDDEPEILTLFRIFLEAEGYYVESASTAKDALARIDAKKFHLAIIDINLPDTHGTELLEQIQSIGPEIIKIVVTGDNLNEGLKESLDNNTIEAYIMKPVKKKVLINLIKEKLGDC